MFFTIQQVKQSLGALAQLHPFFGITFLALKEAGLPVGTTRRIDLFEAVSKTLEKRYKLPTLYDGYYNPFLTVENWKRWIPREVLPSFVQSISSSPFSDSLIQIGRGKVTELGWKKDYVAILQQKFPSMRIPSFDLAIWLFRNLNLLSPVPELVLETLFQTFAITSEEMTGLFDRSLPKAASPWIGEAPVSETDLLEVIGRPPTPPPLQFLELNWIGPAKDSFRYEPGERLNIIAGDNSLGKTFLLDFIWWALTGEWIEGPPLPRKDSPRDGSKIAFSFTGVGGRARPFDSYYRTYAQDWTEPKREPLPGVVIYSRFDGSFAVSDALRVSQHGGEWKPTAPWPIILKRNDVWNGLRAVGKDGREHWLCNGIIFDWVNWQTRVAGHYKTQYEALVRCLKALSPTDQEPLEPDTPIRLPNEAREIPTLRMPYGTVPLVHASAAVQRMIPLAYVTVWAWQEHLILSEASSREPLPQLVLIVDEVEAHLHPRWQRVIVPSIINVVSQISGLLIPITAQIHLATHSPLVMASAETVFDEQVDELHHLRLDKDQVVLEKLPFIKRGKADLWLMSELFGLGHARSLPAERAIEDAKSLQEKETSSPNEVRDVHDRLVKHLAADDEFWPRWMFFAEKHGIEK